MMHSLIKNKIKKKKNPYLCTDITIIFCRKVEVIFDIFDDLFCLTVRHDAKIPCSDHVSSHFIYFREYFWGRQTLKWKVLWSPLNTTIKIFTFSFNKIFLECRNITCWRFFLCHSLAPDVKSFTITSMNFLLLDFFFK